MELVLAVDLKQGRAVHGMSGNRSTYRPLVPHADPITLITLLTPHSLYIADLDRIMGTGDQKGLVRSCACLVQRCYVDRGCRSPEDYLSWEGVVDVAGTETAGDLSRYTGGYVSMDIKDGKVIPGGEHPQEFLSRAGALGFDGAIVLNLGAVGTASGVGSGLDALRNAYPHRLLYGGGVRGTGDLDTLASLGFDGAIAATAVFRGTIPMDAVRRGTWS
jgi:phosphoribosylformimino-5-aminoimidazole carboxamide ribotide isomerase